MEIDSGQEIRAGFYKKTPNINEHRSSILAGMLLPGFIDFRNFSAGSGDFSASFRRNPLISEDLNHRPGDRCTSDFDRK